MKRTQYQNPQEFLTRDIYIATVIKQAGIPLIRVDNHTGRGIFVFNSSENIDGLIMKYFNGELRTDPKGLFETWKALKSMAFSKTNNVK